MATNDNINSPSGTNSLDYEAPDGTFEEAVLEALRTDFWLRHAVDVIKSTYSDDVSVYQKNKDLLKFGESLQVQTSKTTLMDNLSGVYNESYITDNTNTITHFASSSASDTEDIVVEGHTNDGSGNLTFATQTVTLAGQTKTALTTPLNRCTRIYNNGTNDLVGNVYVAKDVTFTAGVPASDVHCMITAGKNNSNKASTSISSTDFWIVTDFQGQWLEKGAGYAEVHLEIRLQGKVFREYAHLAVNDGNPITSNKFLPYLIIPKNADVRLVASASAAGKAVGGEIQGVLVKVV